MHGSLKLLISHLFSLPAYTCRPSSAPLNTSLFAVFRHVSKAHRSSDKVSDVSTLLHRALTSSPHSSTPIRLSPSPLLPSYILPNNPLRILKCQSFSSLTCTSAAHPASFSSSRPQLESFDCTTGGSQGRDKMSSPWFVLHVYKPSVKQYRVAYKSW